MKTKFEQHVKQLRKGVGKENISDDIFECYAYGQDAIGPDLDKSFIPFAVVKPSTITQLASVVKYANNEAIPIYIHGAGTAFKGSAKPKRPNSILLSTEGLTSIEMVTDDMYFEVGAGMNQYKLEMFLKERGYILPMNVGSKYSSTIGGAVSVNTIGHMVDICLGKIIDHVMGLEVVLPNGNIIETGTRSIRRMAGIDYTRFFAGTEGIFGVITKIRMRLIKDFRRAYIVGFFNELTDIAKAFMKYYKEHQAPPLYGELLDKEACRGPFRLRGLGDPKGHMGLAICAAVTSEEAERQAREILECFKSQDAIEARIVTSEKEQTDFWDSRDNILNIFQCAEGEKRQLKAGSLEACSPLSRLAELIDYLKFGHNYKTLHECKLLIYGHVGTCDLHGMWVNDAKWGEEKRKQAFKESLMLESEINLKWGCASGEVGQTAGRIPFLRARYGEHAYSMLLAMKKAVDPNNILNPGNVEGEGYE